MTVASYLRRVPIDVTPLRGSADYRRLWLSQAVSVIGTQLTAVAVPLQIYAQTRSSFLVGLSGLAALLPLVLFGLFGGAVVDAVDRRRLLLATTAGMAAASAVLLGGSTVGHPPLAVLYACVAVQSAAFAIDMPARRAVVARLLPAEQQAAATALSQVLWNVGSVAGPLLAGVLVASLGFGAAYGIDAASFGVAAYAVGRLPGMRPEGGGTRAGVASVVAGLRYLRTRPALAASFVADIDAMVFGMPRALFPALAVTHFGGGAAAAGLLYAAPAMGALGGALVSGPLGVVRRMGLGIVVSIGVWGAAVTGFGLVRQLWLGVVLLAVAGAADMVSAVFRNTMLVVSTPDAMIGRLGGVFTVVVAGGPRLGDLEAGAVAAVAGPGFSVVSGGLASIAGVLLIAARAPALLRYDARAPSA